MARQRLSATVLPCMANPSHCTSQGDESTMNGNVIWSPVPVNVATIPVDARPPASMTGVAVGEILGVDVGIGIGVGGTGLGDGVGTAVAIGTGVGVGTGVMGTGVGNGTGVGLGVGIAVAVGTGVGVLIGTAAELGGEVGVTAGTGLAVATKVVVAAGITVAVGTIVNSRCLTVKANMLSLSTFAIAVDLPKSTSVACSAHTHHGNAE